MTDPTSPQPDRPHPRVADTAEPPEPTETDRHPLLATHRDPSLPDAPDAPAEARRRLQWVRPTDLVARGGALALEQGAKWSRQLHDVVADALHDGRVRLREQLAGREQELTGDAPAAERPAAGRTVVRR